MDSVISNFLKPSCKNTGTISRSTLGKCLNQHLSLKLEHERPESAPKPLYLDHMT